jgi:hypothetical protein
MPIKGITMEMNDYIIKITMRENEGKKKRKLP